MKNQEKHRLQLFDSLLTMQTIKTLPYRVSTLLGFVVVTCSLS